MFELDKEKFGAFEASLRKEKRLTQKELADMLFISDKAVSKWETGNTYPDTALLLPLAEILGVTVSELLLCERMSDTASLGKEQVEDLVKNTILFSEENIERSYRKNGLWGLFFVIALLISVVEIFLCYKYCNDLFVQIAIPVYIPLAVIFGAYFCFFAKIRLPHYYDEHKISVYTDGLFEYNLPGMHFNNSNWPHILTAGRIWSIAVMVAFPAACYLADAIFAPLSFVIFLMISLFVFLGGLFIPAYIVGKKYA